MREFLQGAEPVPGPGEGVDMEDAEVPPSSPPTAASETEGPGPWKKRRVTFSEDESVDVKHRQEIGLE